MKKVVRAKYTPEFKQEAVRMAEAKGAAARSLGLSAQTLSNWVKTEREERLPAAASGRTVSDEQVENARLRAQVARLEMEVEILKKAAAYFAKSAL